MIDSYQELTEFQSEEDHIIYFSANLNACNALYTNKRSIEASLNSLLSEESYSYTVFEFDLFIKNANEEDEIEILINNKDTVLNFKFNEYVQRRTSCDASKRKYITIPFKLVIIAERTLELFSLRHLSRYDIEWAISKIRVTKRGCIGNKIYVNGTCVCASNYYPQNLGSTQLECLNCWWNCTNCLNYSSCNTLKEPEFPLNKGKNYINIHTLT
jgi:hypothetical protein